MSRRIAVSQRVDAIASYRERRDALDQRWSALLRSVSLVCLPVPNDPSGARTWLDAVAPDGIILSGGNSVGPGTNAAPERDAMEAEILDWAAARRVPLLGVCRGMQMLNAHLGGRVERTGGHVAVRHGVEIPDDVSALRNREVNSFHDFAIPAGGLAPPLVATAFAADGTVEACRHPDLPWRGVMWHPEREPALDAADRSLLLELFGGGR